AATLPASVPARVNGASAEIRLLEELGDGEWMAVLFGPGDWRTRTESRVAPPCVREGQSVVVAGLDSEVKHVSALSPRLAQLKFHAGPDAFWNAIYRHGRPVQYAHLAGELSLWHVQTSYAGRPWAVEMPSAGRPLRWSLLLQLRRQGISVVSLTHAAGLSSTGDAALDGALPLAEHFEIPQATADAISQAKRSGGAGRPGGPHGRAGARGLLRAARPPPRAGGVDGSSHRPWLPPKGGRRIAHRHPRAGNEPLRANPGFCERRLARASTGTCRGARLPVSRIR